MNQLSVIGTEAIDCVIVGAGVVGLATARALAIAGYETLIVEANDSFGRETSARNSEVIHAGIHYPGGTRKARLCVRGRELLYDYCERTGVPHRRCGKLIVAVDDSQLPDLERIYATARDNGVSDLRRIDALQVRTMESALRCVAALLSPSTGIIDTHAYMISLLADAERHGAVIAYRAPAEAVHRVDGGLEVTIGGASRASLRTRWLINCAGLDAVRLATCIEGFPPDQIPRMTLAKGSYFTLAGRAPFSRLVYPVPEPGGLGVHLTLDLAGRARFGPDVEWVESIDYAVDPGRARSFYRAIRRYWPDLADGALTPGYAGIRPKIPAPGGSMADFRVDGPTTHGTPGIINLFGIESPGLTASLAIAEEVRAIIEAG